MPGRDLASTERWRSSLERSRARRAAAVKAARRRFRSRGGTLAVAAVLGVGALTAPFALAGGSSGYTDKGDSGSQVAQVQQALGVPADGVFGPETRAAVTQFQERNGLLVDGIVGPETLGALGLASAPAPEASQAPQPEQQQAQPEPQPEQRQQPAEPAPEPQPEQSSGGGGGGGQSTGGSESSGGGGSSTPGVLQDIAQCESGGDPSAVSSDGQYRGKYQFDRQTWQGLGGSGDPAQASEAEQDRLAQQLYQQSGTDPWAGCL